MFLQKWDAPDTIFVQWQQRDAIAQAKRLAKERTTAPESISTKAIDPPPDKYGLNQSFSGLEKQTSEQAKDLQSKQESRIGVLLPDVVVTADREADKRQVPEIRVGSLVQRLQQAYSWVVTQLGDTTAKLQQLHGALECTVPLSDLVAVPIGDST